MGARASLVPPPWKPTKSRADKEGIQTLVVLEKTSLGLTPKPIYEVLYVNLRGAYGAGKGHTPKAFASWASAYAAKLEQARFRRRWGSV